MPSHFVASGDAILLVGTTAGHLGGSAYWAELLDCVGGSPPPIDLERERQLQQFLFAVAGAGLLRSAHDLSDGGLAVALAECCIGGPWNARPVGATIDLSRHADAVSDHGWLFGEDAGRVLLSCAPEHVAAIQREAALHGHSAHYMGLVGDRDGPVVMERDSRRWQWQSRDLRRIYYEAIPRRMAAPVTAGDN